MRKLSIVLAVFAVVAITSAQQAPPPKWDCCELLVGNWKGEGGGAPGQASGGAFSFAFDLQRRVLVRKSFSEYPATKDRPAYRHDDLTVIYDDPQTNTKRADYYDNEGHVIRYAVNWDGQTLTLISDANPGSPTFRLTYATTGADDLKLSFDIAAPGKTEFKTYVEAKAHRVK